jgi:hypothetical protein
MAKYKGLIFQIRSEGVTVSDRRAVKLLKLFAASALFDGRPTVCDGDFFILRHIWNNLDQAELLSEIVNPVVDAYYREHPDERRFIGPQASLEDLLASSPHPRAPHLGRRAVRHPAVLAAQEPERDQGRAGGHPQRDRPAHDPRGRSAAGERLRVLEIRRVRPRCRSMSSSSTTWWRPGARRSTSPARGGGRAARGQRGPGGDERAARAGRGVHGLLDGARAQERHRRHPRAARGRLWRRIIAISSDPAANAEMRRAGADEALSQKALLRSYLVHLGAARCRMKKG